MYTFLDFYHWRSMPLTTLQYSCKQCCTPCIVWIKTSKYVDVCGQLNCKINSEFKSITSCIRDTTMCVSLQNHYVYLIHTLLHNRYVFYFVNFNNGLATFNYITFSIRIRNRICIYNTRVDANKSLPGL